MANRGLSHEAIRKRNTAIAAMREGGATFAAIAKRFRVSRMRAAAIVKNEAKRNTAYEDAVRRKAWA